MYSELAEQLKEGDIGWEHFLAKERAKEGDREKQRGEKSYWDEFVESLRGKGYSLSATVVDARYLTVGAGLFFFVAVGYLVFTLMPQ